MLARLRATLAAAQLAESYVRKGVPSTPSNLSPSAHAIYLAKSLTVE
jgi:hypothetical protein